MLYEVITRIRTHAPVHAGRPTADQSARRNRITSYNVCYTKLLRLRMRRLTAHDPSIQHVRQPQVDHVIHHARHARNRVKHRNRFTDHHAPPPTRASRTRGSFPCDTTPNRARPSVDQVSASIRLRCQRSVRRSGSYNFV